MNTEQGVVASVDATPLGSAFVVAGSIGDTVLQLDDVSDFYSGTRLAINGVIYDYDPATVSDDASTVTIAAPLSVATVVGDAAQVWDTTSGAVAVTVEATIIAQGSDNMGDPIMARVDPGAIPYLPLGPRDPANAADAEAVTIEEIDGVWHVTQVEQRNVMTGNTIQTGAAGGMRMWMQAQVDQNFEGLQFASGLGNETPGALDLWWNYPPGAVPDNPDTTMVGLSAKAPTYGLGGTTAAELILANPTGYPGSGLSEGLLFADQLIVGGTAAGTTSALVSVNATEIELNGAISIGHPSGGGTVINGMDHGYVGTATTNTNGEVVVSHNLGVAPVNIVATPTTNGTTTHACCVEFGATSTQFTLRFYDTTTGSPLNGITVGFYWLAFS